MIKGNGTGWSDGLQRKREIVHRVAKENFEEVFQHGCACQGLRQGKNVLRRELITN